MPIASHLSGSSMAHLVRVAWRHGGFGYQPGYGYHHAYGGGSWVSHMIVSSIIHGLIYGAIFRVLRHLSLSEVVLLAVVVVGGIWLWNRDRGVRRW